MSASLDGYINDREGEFAWSAPAEDRFAAHLAEVQGLGGFLLGRRLYETMLVWETDPAMRHGPLEIAFADAWSALPKIVFSRTLDRVEGNARLAGGPLAQEVAAAREGTDRDLAIGGAVLAGQAIELGLLDELRVFRHPLLVGGGTPLLPPVTAHVPVTLIETRTFADDVVLERYRRA